MRNFGMIVKLDPAKKNIKRRAQVFRSEGAGEQPPWAKESVAKHQILYCSGGLWPPDFKK